MMRMTKYSKVLLIIHAAFFLILYMGKSLNLAETLLFVPSQVVGHFELWRFFTFPFVNTGIWQMLSCAMVFYFFAPTIERRIGETSFLRLYIGINLLLALISSILYVANVANFPIIGSDPIELVILFGFAYLYPKQQILFWFIPLKAWVMVAIIGVMIMLPMVDTGTGFVDPRFYSMLIAILLGFLYFHIKFLQYNLLRNVLSPIHDMIAGRPKNTGDFLGIKAIKKKYKVHRFRRYTEEYQDMQKYVDYLLGKISKSGMSSLTKEEKKFLNKASDTFRKHDAQQ